MVLFPFVVMKEVIRMGRNYKTVRNGKGTELIIGEGKYISAGAEGKNVRAPYLQRSEVTSLSHRRI